MADRPPRARCTCGRLHEHLDLVVCGSRVRVLGCPVCLREDDTWAALGELVKAAREKMREGRDG